MAELLSREKEFLKMNERLDKLAMHGPSDKAPTKADVRYATFTKTKGPSTLLKKRGAGDCFVTPASDASQRSSSRFSGKSGPLRANTVISPVGDASRRMPYGSQRKSLKADSSTRTFSRTSQNRGALQPADTFTVKYRNPKFVESPSLEILIRDEAAAARSDMASESKSPPLSSSPLQSGKSGELSITASRRSQGSQGRKQISTDGLIKFLKSKITILEEDHDRISQEMNEQKDLLEKTLERHKKVEVQRDQAYAKHNSMTEQLKKVESQLEEANRTIKERSAEQLSQQKELEASKREVKVLRQANTNLEKRLYRANEELESTKKAFLQLKATERDVKESLTAQNELKDRQVKTLRQQRADLLNAYKKQLYLIDNLKRQNACVEQSKLLSMAEKEFTKVLEWNVKS